MRRFNSSISIDDLIEKTRAAHAEQRRRAREEVLHSPLPEAHYDPPGPPASGARFLRS
jgi:hypothetical protein